MKRKISKKEAALQTRFTKAFEAWLAENQSQLKRHVRIVRRYADRLTLRIEGTPNAMHCCASDTDINVAVVWKGQWWDSIFWPDCWHRKVKGGVVCACCEAKEKPTVFPNYEALWKDHLFDCLKDWINNELASAKALGIYGRKGGTSATLVRTMRAKKDEDLRTLLPIEPAKNSRL